ncbi:MAG: hypothetical protein RLY49_220 [Candidatus Parcubacteria bacterium]|jgi:hypothetical protein
MFFSDKYVYLIALIPFCIIWILFFIFKPKLRKEILTISFLIGGASVVTSYLWWTKDWWRPQTITGTIVGIEDFIMGFTTGGVMSVLYNFVMNPKIAKRKIKVNTYFGLFLICLMTFITVSLFLFFGLTSFWSSFIAMISIVLLIMYLRKDLIINSLVSGILMFLISTIFYGVILFMSDTWVTSTYLHGLSGIKLFTIPVEEFIFWFIAGMWVGPFYEAIEGIRYRKK